MPRKGKKSQAAKLRWSKLDLSDPRFQSAEPHRSDGECGQVRSQPVVSSSCTAQLQVQDHNGSVIATSENDNIQEQCILQSEISVQATTHQGRIGYAKSRNKQCTCMALTFLAYHNEADDLRKDDLDKILHKGNQPSLIPTRQISTLGQSPLASLH